MPDPHLDDDLEIRIPRHDATSGRHVPIEPAAHALSRPKRSKIPSGSFGIPNVRDWFFFSVELQTALGAGLPFVRAVSMVAEGAHHRSIRRAAGFILDQMAAGSGGRVVAENKMIPPLIRNLLAVGLRGGDAPAALEHVTRHYQWLLEIRSRILSVLTYPSGLIILGTLVMILRDVMIATLTGSMSTGEAAVKYSIFYCLPVASGVVAAIIIAWLLHLPGVRPVYDRVILTAPIVGKMIHQYSQAVFCRVLALLIEAGMPITDAWNLTINAIPNDYIGKRLEAGSRFLQDGESLAEAMRQSGIMDMESKAMASVGEAAGSTPKVLRKYGDYRELELRSRVKGLTSILGILCLPFIVLGYFVNPIWLSILAFLIVFLRRMI